MNLIFRAVIPVLPVIDGTLSSEIALAKLRSVRAYTSHGAGDCFQTRQELRAAKACGYLGGGRLRIV
jgi:hypothetical protein